MSTLNVILLALVAITAVAVAFFLRKQLFPSWTDFYKAFADNDYSLAFFLHRQFRQQVLSGKQRYDRFVQQANASRLADYENPKRPSYDVGLENNRRQRMREMLGNEAFIRACFKDEPFRFEDWQKMLGEWNQLPVNPEPVSHEELPAQDTEEYIEDPNKEFLLPLDQMFSGKAPRDLKDRIESLFDRKAPTGKEMAVIIAVLQHHCYFKFGYSNKDIVQAFSNTQWKRQYTFKAYSTVMDYLKDSPREYYWEEFNDIEKRLCKP